MLSNILDRISFWSLFVIITLLPIFFLPFTKIPVEISKGLLLVIGLTISIIFWAVARFFDGKIVLPKSWILLSGLGVVLIYLLSSIFSSARGFSFFGTMLDVGSFYFVFSAFLLMFISSIVLKDSKKSKIIFLGVVLSSVLVLVFQVFHMILPKIFSFGVLTGATNSLVGSFNSFGILAGLVVIVSIFIFTFFSFSKKMKYIFAFIILLSIFMMALVNFSFIWIILGIFALFIFVYKISFSTGLNSEGKKRTIFSFVPFLIVIICLLFFVGGNSIGGFLPNHFGISNSEVSPSFSSTVSVAKSVLIKHPILGSGPNSFSSMWDLYKPIMVNNTDFWDTSFETGLGLLPTFMLTTGSLGILSWVLFLILMIFIGFKALFSFYRKNLNNIEIILFFFLSLYLFVSSFFYSSSPVIILWAFAFLGIFIGLSSKEKEKGEITFEFLNDPRKSFFMIILLIIIILVSITACFKYIERFASIPYFQKTLSSNSIEVAESNINRAVSLYSNDLYLRTYTQVYLLKFNSLVAKGSSLTDLQKADTKTSFDQVIKSAELATQYNKTNYLNFKSLGLAYESVASSVGQDAYNKAIEAYKKASELNPLNPGLKLALARVYFVSGNIAEAKNSASQALALKGDYIDALVVISQIFKSEGNTKDALAYGRAALSLAPQDTQLSQYVDSLSIVQNSSSSVVDKTKENKKTQ
jgi:tetratricopeptide (TPR) repeat protein